MENASSIWDKVIKIMVAAAGAVGSAFGGWTITMTVMVVAMVIDYITGMAVAIAGKSTKTAGGHLDSNVGWNGLMRKGIMLLVVLVAAYLDKAFGNGHAIRDAAAWFYIANEGLSMLENAALLGVPFPSALKNLLDQTKEKDTEQDKSGQMLM